MAMCHWYGLPVPEVLTVGSQITVGHWVWTCGLSLWASLMVLSCGQLSGYRLPIPVGFTEGSWLTLGHRAQTLPLHKPQRWFSGVERLLGTYCQSSLASEMVSNCRQLLGMDSQSPKALEIFSWCGQLTWHRLPISVGLPSGLQDDCVTGQ